MLRFVLSVLELFGPLDLASLRSLRFGENLDVKIVDVKGHARPSYTLPDDG